MNINPLRILLFALFVAANAWCFARARVVAGEREDFPSKYNSQTWTTEHGLPGDTVRAVTQTRDGYLWAATQAGLARFDGVRFTVFSKQNEPAFRANECNTLLEARDGSLWIGTIGGGLMHYKDGKFESYGRAEGLLTDVVINLYEDLEGRLWITSYETLTLFEHGRFKSFNTADPKRDIYAFPFHEDAEGRVWAFNAYGASINNSGSLIFYQRGEMHAGEEAERIFPIKLSSYSFVFTGRGGAFWINDRETRTLTRFREGFIEDQHVTYEDKDAPVLAHEAANGDLWFINGHVEMHLVSEGRLARVKLESMPHGQIGALYSDREGNLWAASSGGLARLKRQPFASYTGADGLSNETAWTIFEDSRKDIWIGTNSGLNRLRNGVFDIYRPKDGMAGDGAISITEDAQGRLWFASTTGLISLSGGRFKSYEKRDGLLNENVRAVYSDSRGRLWVGTLGGLQLFDADGIKDFTTADGMSHNNVLFISEDREGSLWVGTPNGLNRMRDGRFDVFTTSDGLGSNIVIASHEASDGSLWFGMVGGGLARYSAGKFKTITSASGLGDDTITSILEDDAGNLWMGSTRGVMRAGLKELNAFAEGRARSLSCVIYGKADGLPTTDCSGGTQPAGWRTRDGRLWFATSKGVTFVDPRSVARNEVAPPVLIENLVVDREPKVLAEGIELQPGSRAIEMHFTALSFVDPSKVKFRYRLEGFDRDWIDAGTRREAFYTNLPPGGYRFRVIAANDDGVWNEQGAMFAFTLRPYFYQTIWFYLLCALLLAALMWGVHLVRVRQVRREFAAMLSERNRIARELHDTLAQGFTSVSMQLEAVSAKMGGDGADAARTHLNQARLLVRSSLAEARRSVRDLRSELLDGGLAGALAIVAEQLTSGTDVRAEVSVAGKARRLDESIERTLLRVGQEALTNSVRHASASRVCVRLDYNDRELVRLDITDNGSGFDAQRDKASHNGDNIEREGGFGLTGMRERVAHIGGELTINSHRGTGTEICVIIPLNGHDKR